MNYKLNYDLKQKLNNKNIKFTKAKIEDLEEIINLFRERILWFKENDIDQWTKYLEQHPKAEFEETIKNSNYFILKANNKIIASFEVSTDSKLWKDNTTEAYYIYKLATKVNYKKLGNIIFEICKNIAENNSKDFLRLDCKTDNIKLNKIYENHGFLFKKSGAKAYYKYSLREYRMKETSHK